MSQEELALAIQALQEQLAENSILDQDSVDSLRDVLNQIEVSLQNSTQVRSPESDTLMGKLSDAIVEIEARHPKLTVALSQIADRLADMGI